MLCQCLTVKPLFWLTGLTELLCALITSLGKDSYLSEPEAARDQITSDNPVVRQLGKVNLSRIGLFLFELFGEKKNCDRQSNVIILILKLVIGLL